VADPGRTTGTRTITGLSALAGLLALGAAMALAELTAGFTGPDTVPVVEVGTAVIPLTPESVKEAVIRQVGTSDKTVLIAGTIIVVILFAALAGVVGRRHPTIGNVLVVALGAVGAIAAATRPTAAPLDVAPSVVAAVVGVLVLQFLLARVRGLTAVPAPPPPPLAAAIAAGRRLPSRRQEQLANRRGAGAAPRRRFLAAAGGVGAAAVAGGAIGGVLVGKRYDREAARAEIVLPKPASPAPTQPAGAQVSKVVAPGGTASPIASPTPSLPSAPATATATTAPSPSSSPSGSVTGPPEPTVSAAASTPAATAASQDPGAQVNVEGVSDFFISDADFYRIDTSLIIPEQVAATWSLRIHGMVDREIRITWAELLKRPLVERDITLSCVSNDVGGTLVGNARWLGALIAPLLTEAGLQPGAQQLVSRDIHGMTIGTPVKAVMDGRDAMLAVGMNGTPLPFAHGFPVRMVVPGLYGYVSACKWIVDIEVTTWNAYDAYWVQRGWTQQGPIKTESRIDTPSSGVRSGLVPVAGVAWAPHTGIEKVEVQVDHGGWETATLAPVATDDTWREWVYAWLALPGNHTLQVRATDKSGYTQTSAQAQPFPSGATGWHTVSIGVS
jgi:DMSO/TMAO reductase YedYZ molybdopterin-dependent catalytic subunit